jgi:hypothetical protein
MSLNIKIMKNSNEKQNESILANTETQEGGSSKTKTQKKQTGCLKVIIIAIAATALLLLM